MSESATPESGALSIDQAIATLAPEPVDEQATPEAPVEAAEEPEIEAEASPAEEPESEAEEPAEGEAEATEEEPVAALDPPPYWKQEAKAVFATLTPEQQAVVLAQEGPREEITAKVKAEAAEKIKVADAELGKVAQLASALADRLPGWISTFEARWGTETPDWVAYAEEHGAEATTLVKLQFEQERSRLTEAAQATQVAQTQAKEAFYKAEHARLAEIAPDLADPVAGPAKRTEITQYLVTQGLAPEAIRDISAGEMVLARKAMLYDRAQAALKAKPAPKPTTAPAQRAPVRPAAAAPPSSPQRTAQAAQARFNLDPSPENAAALLLAKG